MFAVCPLADLALLIRNAKPEFAALIGMGRGYSALNPQRNVFTMMAKRFTSVTITELSAVPPTSLRFVKMDSGRRVCRVPRPPAMADVAILPIVIMHALVERIPLWLGVRLFFK